MSLTDQIQRERKTIDQLEDAIKEAREKLWEAKYVATHDARRKGESDEHWHKRRARNRESFENREEVVEHLVKKKKAHQRLLEKLKKDKKEFQEERAEERDGKYQKGSTKIVIMDGKSIVEDLAYWLQLIRDKGMWSGVVVSGYRTPAYSTQLCYGICGAPSCPGRCAGASSNHAKLSYPGPAADVTDYFRCEDALIDVGSGYSNNLPIDRVHMSRSGT